MLSLVTTRARHTRGSRTLQTAAAPLSWIPQLMVQGSTKSMDGHRSSYCHQPPSLLQLLWMVTSTPTNIQRRIPKQHQGTQLRLFLLQVVLLHRSPTFPVVQERAKSPSISTQAAWHRKVWQEIPIRLMRLTLRLRRWSPRMHATPLRLPLRLRLPERCFRRLAIFRKQLQRQQWRQLQKQYQCEAGWLARTICCCSALRCGNFQSWS